MCAKILVVDDEQQLVDLLKENLEREGYEVITANDGDTAIEMTEHQNPDLIILDWMMPGKSGLDVWPTKTSIGSRTERLIGHIGTETRPRLLREAAVGNIGQWAKA